MVFVALVFLDLVFQAQFLQQPQDALRAGVVQMVDNDHVDIPKKERPCAAIPLA
jgi:hypothetical protein